MCSLIILPTVNFMINFFCAQQKKLLHMLPNRQLLTSFPVISDKGTKGKEKFVVDLNKTHKTLHPIFRFFWYTIFPWPSRFQKAKLVKQYFIQRWSSNSQKLIQQNSSRILSFYWSQNPLLTHSSLLLLLSSFHFLQTGHHSQHKGHYWFHISS